MPRLFRTLIFLLSYGALAVACAPASQESAIYRAFFAQVFKVPDGKTLIVAVDPADPNQYGESKELAGYTFAKEPKFFQEDFGKVKIHLLSRDEIDDFFKNGCAAGWKAFHEKYPNSVLLGFSRVAVQGEKAALYVEARVGCLGSTGIAYFFEIKNNEWHFTSSANIWIS